MIEAGELFEHGQVLPVGLIHVGDGAVRAPGNAILRMRTTREMIDIAEEHDKERPLCRIRDCNKSRRHGNKTQRLKRPTSCLDSTDMGSKVTLDGESTSAQTAGTTVSGQYKP